MKTVNQWYSVRVKESYSSPDELVDALRYIAGQIEEGYTSGYNPTWEIEYEEEEIRE